MKTESSIFTTITNIRPKLSHFKFKMFKAFVPTKPMATPQELVYHERKITVLRIHHSITSHL